MEKGKGNVIIVQGGQYGSEAKGLITHKLTIERHPAIAIRTGTVNAGHTVYYEGQPRAMQQLPVSWVDSSVLLVLGPGAYINPEILKRELDWISVSQPTRSSPFVFIDYRCGIHTQHHTDLARVADRHHKMGATGKGCSEAVVHKIASRGDIPATFLEWMEENPGWHEDRRIHVCDTVEMVNSAYDDGKELLIEGTQGTLLDLHLGPYPYTTHKQTQAASWLAEAGLSANVNKEIWGVYRTFPIRVAGNSGPLPNEISWPIFTRMFNSQLELGVKPFVSDDDLIAWNNAFVESHTPGTPYGDPAAWTPAERSQFKEVASEIHRNTLERLPDDVRSRILSFWEVTTVTRKLRRIAEWDWNTFRYSITLNRPDRIAMTFMNYRYPTLWGADIKDAGASPAWYDADQWLGDVEDAAGCPVSIASFGPGIEHTHMIDDSHIYGRQSR